MKVNLVPRFNLGTRCCQIKFLLLEANLKSPFLEGDLGDFEELSASPKCPIEREVLSEKGRYIRPLHHNPWHPEVVMTDPEDKGFTVKDRRFFQQSEEEKERLREESRQQEAVKEVYESEANKAADTTGPQAEGPAPEITFASFLMSLGTSVFFHLGDLPHPETGATEKNLPLAKQTIDLLGLLREKTRNNLTPEEENIFDHLLYDLRMRYVKEINKPGGS